MPRLAFPETQEPRGREPCFSPLACMFARLRAPSAELLHLLRLRKTESVRETERREGSRAHHFKGIPGRFYGRQASAKPPLTPDAREAGSRRTHAHRHTRTPFEGSCSGKRTGLPPSLLRGSADGRTRGGGTHSSTSPSLSVCLCKRVCVCVCVHTQPPDSRQLTPLADWWRVCSSARRPRLLFP